MSKGIKIYAKTIIILGAAVFMIWALLFGGLGVMQNAYHPANIQPTTPPVATPAPGTGAIPLSLTLPFYMFNGTFISAGAASPQAMLFVNSVSPTNLVGQSSAGAAITGAVIPAASYYLLVAPSTTGTYGTLDNLVAGSATGVVVGSPTVVTYQGNYWTQYPVSFSNVGQISTGVTAAINLYGYVAETAGTTSLLNSTAIGTSSYGYATTTSYFSGWTGTNFGQGYKIVRMELNMSATNATSYDSGHWTLKSVTINMGNGQSMTTSNINWMGVSNAYIEVGNSNGATYLYGQSVMPQYVSSALPVLYGQSDSATGTLTINFNWYGEQPSGETLVCSLKLVAMSPTGAFTTSYSTLSVS